MKLQREEIASPVGEIEDVDPFQGPRHRIEAETLHQDLVVWDRHRDVDEPVTKTRGDRYMARVDGRVQLERQRVARGRTRGGRRAVTRREDHGLAAVVTKAQLAQDVERGLVVAEIRSAEAGRVDAAALEYLQRARDGLSLRPLVQRCVVAVHEPVHRQLRTAVRVALQHIGMPSKHARRRRPGRPSAQLRRDGVVPIEVSRHRVRGRPESGQHAPRSRR